MEIVSGAEALGKDASKDKVPSEESRARNRSTVSQPERVSQ
jgi:hypothetical protein